MMRYLFILGFLFASLWVFPQHRIEKLFYENNYEAVLSVLAPKVNENKAGESELIMAAKCYLAAFQYTDAAGCFEKILEKNTENSIAREGLADIQTTLNFKKEALQNYSLLPMPSKYDSLRIIGKKASVFLDLNYYEDAADLYTQLFTLDSANVFFFRRLMLARYKQKQYLPVVKLYVDTLNSAECKADKDVKMMAADSYSKFGDYIHSLELLDEIFKLDSTYIPALSKAAYIHFSTYKNYQDAVVLYRKLNKLENAADPFHLRNQAICEYFTGNSELAAPMLDSLITEISNDAFIPFYAGLAYKKNREFDKSLEMLELATQIVIPVYAGDIFHHLGRAYASQREFEKAIETYKKVLEYDSANYQVLYDIAVTYEEYSLNRSVALGYYKLYLDGCPNVRAPDYTYAENRVKRIKEELFFDGQD
jgi:tetratricopeptide (TPR) repeat protein